MKAKKVSFIVGVIVILVLAAGVAGAIPNQQPEAPSAVTAAVTSGISYQGRLTSPGGSPLNGSYTMRFVVYDAAVAGTALWDSGNMNVAVANGLFTVILGVDQSDFNGQAVWLSIIVDGETLSPRQEILPAPYALSLRPGADMESDAIGSTDAILAGYAPATGTALYANANGGVGLFGDSEQSYGVWGTSDSSWGGYFTSQDGYGLRVDTNGTDHYDHGAYITSEQGYAVYAQSTNNMAVRGEAGNITGLNQPLGPVGLVGIGASRGAYGSSGNGSGVYGTSDANYGMWGQSETYRGVTGRTDREDNNYGFYTPDNLYSVNINMAGSMMQVMQNNGKELLSPGDVVVFNGINEMVTAVDSPIVQVSKVGVADSTAVAGVVYSRFNIDAVDPALESPDGTTNLDWEVLDPTPAGDAAPGEYVLVVVQGAAQVNVSALSSSIQPGDLLATSSTAGMASKASTVSVNGVETAVPGTVFGKALEPVDGTQEMIYVYVTLQ
ncbi:MAG: hypothetical protein CL608_29080 [Anaerolineaceae bacterium]|nr:hypothetical protein [Anaerolineaceae bacterium]